MEREQEIVAAKKVLRRFLSLKSKRHIRGARIHRQAAEDNHNRLRALDGLCGQCVSLRLKFRRVDAKDVVAVLCNKQYSPLDLYDKTLMGQEAACYGFKKVT